MMITAYELTDLLIAALALLANFGALFFLAIEVRRTRQESRKENVRRAREATLNYYASTLNERNSLRAGLPELDNNDWLSNPETRRQITRYLAYWELLSSGVNLGIYDFETVKMVAGKRIITIWSNWESFIINRRANSNNQKLYIELEKIATKLNSSRNSSPQEIDESD